MKTVSWYLHTFLVSYARLVVVTPDRMQREMRYSQALNNYGWRLVKCAVVTDESITLLLFN